MSTQSLFTSLNRGHWLVGALGLCVLLLLWNPSAFAQKNPELEKLTPEQVQAELKRVNELAIFGQRPSHWGTMRP